MRSKFFISPDVSAKFYQWTVLAQRMTKSHVYEYFCRCDCGTEAWVKAYDVRSGRSKRCAFCASKIAVASRKIK